jgi:hypothetical protein
MVESTDGRIGDEAGRTEPGPRPDRVHLDHRGRKHHRVVFDDEGCLVRGNDMELVVALIFTFVAGAAFVVTINKLRKRRENLYPLGDL